MFVSDRPFQPSLICVGVARSLTYSGASAMSFTYLDSDHTHKHQTKVEKLAGDKHSSLFKKFVNYGSKKFNKIGLKAQCYITFCS